MASIAAKAERLALAVQSVEEAMAELAAARGLEAPPLPAARDPMIAQAMRLEVVAAFLRDLNAAAATPTPDRRDTKRKG